MAPPPKGRAPSRLADAAFRRKLALALVALVAAVVLPQVELVTQRIPLTSLIPVLLFVILALGLNVVVGFAGLLDLGYAAFFAIGAYSAAFLTSPQSPIPYVQEHPVNFFLAMLISTMVAAIFGVVLGAPTLRLRGDYLAIVTLGFGEIVPRVVRNTPDYTKGTQGMNPIGLPEIPFVGVKFGIDTMPWYYLVLAVLLLSIVIVSRLRTSRMGRAWMAIREDEVAAASMGINLVTTKLFAFALGASFSGFAGSIYASYLQVIAPEQFKFDVSIFVLSMIVLGGMGNIWGVVAGGILLGLVDRLLPTMVGSTLRTLADALAMPQLRDIDVAQARTFVFGLVLVVMMLVRPEGLFPSARRRMELHAADESTVTPERASLSEVRK